MSLPSDVPLILSEAEIGLIRHFLSHWQPCEISSPYATYDTWGSLRQRLDLHEQVARASIDPEAHARD